MHVFEYIRNYMTLVYLMMMVDFVSSCRTNNTVATTSAASAVAANYECNNNKCKHMHWCVTKGCVMEISEGVHAHAPTHTYVYLHVHAFRCSKGVWRTSKATRKNYRTVNKHLITSEPTYICTYVCKHTCICNVYIFA